MYFGKDNPPPFDIENLDYTHINKSDLDTATVYYWQVVAKDSKGAESASDLWQFKTTPNPIPTGGLIAYWPFNGNANDESGNGNDGTVYGATLTTDRFGNENSAYYFDGEEDYIKIKKEINEISKEISFSLWVNTAEFPEGYAEPLRKEDGYHVSFLGKNISNVGLNIELGIKTRPERSYWHRLYIPFTEIPLNSWIHLALTANGTEMKIYLNGEQYSNSLKYSGNIYNTPENKLFIGTYGTTERTKDRDFHGIIDDIALYNRALNKIEIRKLYHSGGWGK
ncbi:LamG domain-containing protein [Calditrichota bacterium GD2]